MMDETTIATRLNSLALRLAAAERPAFAFLVADIEAASAIAAQPLDVAEEPESVLRLAPIR